MKRDLAGIVAFCGIIVISASPSLAATFKLTNGGLGQAATNPQQFGVAVCNKSAQTLTSAVPVSVTVDGQTVSISSSASITPGQCQYRYLPYSQLGMQAGQTYAVDVVIDPQGTIISNADNGTTYSVTVPGQLTAATGTGNLTANIGNNVSNPFVEIWNWIVDLFKSL